MQSCSLREETLEMSITVMATQTLPLKHNLMFLGSIRWDLVLIQLLALRIQVNLSIPQYLSEIDGYKWCKGSPE